jgi:hypothetical protein
MTDFKFRNKPVTSPIGVAALTIFVIFAMAVCALVQPLFWLFGLRGPFYWNKSGGLECVSDGSFQRKRS